MRSVFLLALLFVVATADAQNRPNDLEPLPEAPDFDAGFGAPDEPQVTIIQRGEDKVEEYRMNGRLFMMKVTPKHGVPYYLVDQTGSGQFARVDSLGTGLLSVPMWTIIRF